jgi:stage III sporulation protein AB
MVFIKYILIFFIIIISLVIGRAYSKKYSNRVEELEQMKNILNVMKAKIKFTTIALPDIFDSIAKENKNNIGRIFEDAKEYMQEKSTNEAWRKAVIINSTKTSFKKEDIEVVMALGKMLGSTDVDGQVNQIDLCTERLSQNIQEAEREKLKNAKLYKTLGLTIGLGLAIILF